MKDTVSLSGNQLMINRSFYKNKNILVAGGSGMIGIAVVKKLLEYGANVKIVSLETKKFVGDIFGNKVDFARADLCDLRNCLNVTRGYDYVFNLVGIKGSVGIGEGKAASYLVPMLRFQTNLMDAAYKNNVEKFLFVSSICAYPQSSRPKEEDTVWDGMPRQNDRIPGIAKRVGELQGETYLKEYGWDAVRIVRPANVYGPFDDFDPKTGQVIPALIARIFSGENPLEVWGDGSAKRDFIYVEDVVDGMLLALEKAPPCLAINIGSGKGQTICKLASIITSLIRARKLLDFKPKTEIKSGIKKTIEWYQSEYNLFSRLKYS